MKRLLIILPFLCIGIVGRAQDTAALRTLDLAATILQRAQFYNDTSVMYDSASVVFKKATFKKKGSYENYILNRDIVRTLEMNREKYLFLALQELGRFNTIMKPLLPSLQQSGRNGGPINWGENNWDVWREVKKDTTTRRIQ